MRFPRLREYKLTGLQFFYEFCIREQITDIHLMELKQETLFQELPGAESRKGTTAKTAEEQLWRLPVK